MEQAFGRLTIPCAGIRAGWFMENFIGSIDAARQTGTLQSFIHPIDLAIPMIAASDIGKLAAELLTTEWTTHRIIELEGPCKYSAKDVAMILSYHFKQNIEASAIPENDYAATYESFGFTPEAADLMAEMNRAFNSRWIDFTGKEVEIITGSTLLEDVLRNYIQ